MTLAGDYFLSEGVGGLLEILMLLIFHKKNSRFNRFFLRIL
jgi:hypothetical protein